MSDFFTSRIDSYERHMLENVAGCAQCYRMMAAMIPPDASELLDLGCGTGLELDHIYKLHPSIRVTGIDLTTAMLDRLRKKHTVRLPKLILGDYRSVSLGKACFDVAVSFESLHHLTANEKADLYERIHQSLKPGGTYIECDYMVADYEAEARFLAEYARFLPTCDPGNANIYHIDIPLCTEHQQDLLRKSGFRCVELLYRHQDTAMILARKQPAGD